MIRLSPGMLNAASWLINTSKNHVIQQHKILSDLNNIIGVKAADVIETSIKCQWIYIDSEDIIHPSLKAEDYSSFSVDVSRRMLRDFILQVKPAWMLLLKRGRKESVPYLDKDSQACFYNSELMNNPIDDLAASWWIQLESKIFQINNDANAMTGLVGEQLSLKYEEKRVGRMPDWYSIDSNKVGFDLLSIVDPLNDFKLKIEVKSSKNEINEALIHITYNEWLTAISSTDYVFHLWLISNRPQIAVIDKTEMVRHIPICSGDGKWETVEIPFNTFNDYFMPYNYHTFDLEQ